MPYNYLVKNPKKIVFANGPNGDESITYYNLHTSTVQKYKTETFSANSYNLIGYQSSYIGQFVLSQPQYIYPCINNTFAIDNKQKINNASVYLPIATSGSSSIIYRHDTSYIWQDNFQPDLDDITNYCELSVSDLASPGTYQDTVDYYRKRPLTDTSKTVTYYWQGYLKDNAISYNNDLDNNHSGVYYLWQNTSSGLQKYSTKLIIGSPVMTVDPAIANTNYAQDAMIRLATNAQDDNYTMQYVKSGTETIYNYKQLSANINNNSFKVYLVNFRAVWQSDTEHYPSWASPNVNYYIVIPGNLNITDYNNLATFDIYFTTTQITENETVSYTLTNKEAVQITLRCCGFSQINNNIDKQAVLIADYISLSNLN